jgi:hypothetical protein
LAHDPIGKPDSTFRIMHARSRLLSRPRRVVELDLFSGNPRRFPRISSWQCYRREVSPKRSAQRSNFTGEIAAGVSIIIARLR